MNYFSLVSTYTFTTENTSEKPVCKTKFLRIDGTYMFKLFVISFVGIVGMDANREL